MIKKVYSLIRRYYKKLFPEYKKEQFGSIGPHCILGSNSRLVPSNIYMEDYSIIQGNNNFISFKGRLFIKKYSVISSGCIIVPSNHVPAVGIPFYGLTLSHIGDEDNDIIIEEDVWIGAGCILLPHCKIGRGCIVGAGSIVTKSIPPYSVALGCPAKVVAVKFSLEDAIRHEEMIYNKSERYSRDYLERLYQQEYNNLSIIANHSLSKEDYEAYNSFVKKYMA